MNIWTKPWLGDMAPSVAAPTLLRFVQGAAGAAGIAIALAIVSDLSSARSTPAM